jgi:hypothetical protein
LESLAPPQDKSGAAPWRKKEILTRGRNATDKRSKAKLTLEVGRKEEGRRSEVGSKKRTTLVNNIVQSHDTEDRTRTGTETETDAGTAEVGTAPHLSLISQSGRELGERSRGRHALHRAPSTPLPAPLPVMPFSLNSIRTGDYVEKTAGLDSIPFSRVVAVQSKRGLNSFSRLMTFQVSAGSDSPLDLNRISFCFVRRTARGSLARK